MPTPADDSYDIPAVFDIPYRPPAPPPPAEPPPDRSTFDVPPDQPVAGGAVPAPFEPSHLPGTPPRQRPERVRKKKGSFAQQRPKGNPKKNKPKKK